MSDVGVMRELPVEITAPGVVMRLSQSLGAANDVFQLEGSIDQDASQEEFDHLADKMVRVAARQRAIHQLPDIRRQLENVEYKHNDNRKRLAELNAGEAEAAKIRDEKAAELQQRAGKIESEAQDAHYASGRRGEFKPTGSVAGELARVKAQLSQLDEGMTKQRNEAAVQRATLENEVKDGERAVSQLTALIREQEALARGEDISGVAAKEG